VRSLYVEPESRPEEVDWGALEFHDVFKIYRSGPAQTVALRGLDLRLEQRERTAVLGPSGSGKSTLLALAAGLDTPTAGEVRAAGLSLGRLDERELASYRAERIALVFQSDNLWPGLSALENVATALHLAGRPEPKEEAAAALDSFGLAGRHGHRAGELSGGEQQRVAIAAAAARQAELVLADEPTGELDEANEARVLEALEALTVKHGSTVVTVTHSERVAAAADRVIEVRDGRVV
jgi:putative ABC transport system ATP-binding protein